MYQDLMFQIDMGPRAYMTATATTKIGKELQRLLGSKIETLSQGLMNQQLAYKVFDTALTKQELKSFLESAYVNSRWKIRVQEA